MKTITKVIYTCLVLLILGTIFYFQNIPGKNVFIALSLIGIAVSMLSAFIIGYSQNEKNYFHLYSCLLLIGVSSVIYIKYLHWSLFDNYSIIIVLAFCLSLLILLFRKFNKVGLIFKIVYGVYTILLIPTFILVGKGGNTPNTIFKSDIYTNIHDVKSYVKDFPVDYKYEKTKQLIDSASTFYANNKIELCLVYYHKAIEQEPQNSILRYYYTLCMSKYTDNAREIIKQLDTVLLYKPGFYEAYVNRGLMKYKLWDNEGAIIDCDKAIAIDSVNPTAYMNKALALYSLGKKDESCTVWRIAEQKNRIYNSAEMRAEILKEKEKCSCL